MNFPLPNKEDIPTATLKNSFIPRGQVQTIWLFDEKTKRLSDFEDCETHTFHFICEAGPSVTYEGHLVCQWLRTVL